MVRVPTLNPEIEKRSPHSSKRAGAPLANRALTPEPSCGRFVVRAHDATFQPCLEAVLGWQITKGKRCAPRTLATTRGTQ